jgi:NitT/TauT family transport system substrate-binding protein
VKRINRRSFLALSGGALGAAFLSACGDDDGSPGSTSSGAGGNTGASGATGTQPISGRLRLGFFPNVTHVQPNVGVERGTFAEALGPGVELQTITFNAGPSAIEAMFAGELDATYIGPNPAINGFVRSNGEAVRILGGAVSGGALLIVRFDAGIASAADFANKTIASPQLGNTQDVALRAWLAANGLNAKEQGGNVEVLPIANADALAQFQAGGIDGAWAIEPWATRLILEGGGVVFLDERELWPDGDFVTTHLIARPSYIEDNPGIVEAMLGAHVELTEWVNANEAEAKTLVNQSIEKITQAALPQAVIDGAWKNFRVTYDPIASSLQKSADHAYALGFLDSEPDLTEIYDLSLLNKVLSAKGLPPVEGLA